jgi:PhnB protein
VVSRLNPYLSFARNARQAMKFYQSVFGGTLTMSTYGEYGAPDGPEADGIMHGQLETASGYTLIAPTPHPAWNTSRVRTIHGEPQR